MNEEGKKIKDLVNFMNDNRNAIVKGDALQKKEEIINEIKRNKHFINSSNEAFIYDLNLKIQLSKLDDYINSVTMPDAAAAHEAGSGVFVPDSLLKYRSQIDTPRARKYFPKAIEAGIIKRAKSGYLKLVSSKALLAYFLNKVYSVGTFPDTALNLLFNESRLKQSIYRTNEGNKNGKPKGYELIDELFDEE